MTSPSPDKSRQVVYPRGVIATDRLPVAVAVPASWLYDGLSSWWRRIGLSRRPGPPADTCVVSIGNIEVGGNGKTPFAIYLIEVLAERGHRPVYLSRGYGSASERLGKTTVVPVQGSTPPTPSAAARVIDRASSTLPQEIGDEGAVVAVRCPQVPLLFDRDRRRGIEVAVALFGATHVVIDDAFQTWRVPRHLDVVLVDRSHPFGNGRLLPAGTLREKPAALARADVVGVNGIEDESDLDACAALVAQVTGMTKDVFGVRRRLSFRTASGQALPTPKHVASLSAIARPSGFDRSLMQAGADVPLSIRYPDHYRYNVDDVAHVRSLLAAASIDALVTTEKDWVKLAPYWSDGPALVIARLEVDIVGGDTIWREIEKPRTGSAASARR